MSPTYKKTSMDASEMSNLIKAAKQQSLERSQKEEAKKKKMVVASNVDSPKILTNPTDVESIEHGSYVQTEDGMGAIIIDHELELEKRQSNDKTGQALLNLLNPVGLISDANQYIPNYGEDAPEGYDPGVQFINENPYHPQAKRLKEIKSGFSNLVLGLPGHGLVSADSDEGKMVTEAFHKLETGEIVLPTPEEYEKQKEEAKKKREQERLERQAKAKEALKLQTNQNNTETHQIEDNIEPQMAEMPEKVVIKKGVDELMNVLESGNNNQVTPDTPEVGNITKNPTSETNPNEQATQPTPKSPTVFNLAEAEEEVNEVSETVPETESTDEEIKPNEVVHIDVPAGEVNNFMETLPLETYDKVVKSKVIKVNEVELKDIPTATTRVTNIADYKRLTKRRPRTKMAEVTERVLINSGFVITVKGATSLEMATIFTNPNTNDVDWEKEYNFCYEHTVGTSIGKLSYNEFLAKVDPTDIETILAGIYEISETDTRNISIICGTNDGGCGESYEVEVKISDLPNFDDVTNEMKERIKKIVDAKNSVDDTKRIVEDSPTSIVKVVKLGEDRFVKLRTTTGNMMIERIDRIDDISQVYGALIAVLVLYVESITVQVQERPDVEPRTYLLDTTELICEELLQLNDEELQCVKDIITNELPQYRPITYSIKGPCKCPHCGNVKNSIPCSISDLVFQKAQSVLA